MLSSAELTALRAAQAATFDQSAVIKRLPTFVSDGAGGATAGSPTTVATVACRVAPANVADTEMVAAAGVVSRQVWRVTVPQGTDVRAADWLTIGGRTLDVMAIYGPRSFETARVLVCVERS
jgi:hypothetical protein